jgi:hypothetical protein
MSRPKRYRVTVRQTKKYTVELEAADESEAQTEAIANASRQVMATVRAAPRSSSPKVQPFSDDEWTADDPVEIGPDDHGPRR